MNMTESAVEMVRDDNRSDEKVSDLFRIRTCDEAGGEGGLAVCDVCGRPRQKRIIGFRDKPFVVPVLCACEEQAIREEEALAQARAKNERIERKRATCFGDDRLLLGYTFEAADERSEEQRDACERYAESFSDAGRYGILLHGPVGSGKTYLAASIANRLLDHDFTVRMTDIGSIVTCMESSFKDRQANLDRILDCDLLVLDDLGVERQTDYMMQYVHAIIDGRYRRAKPMVITTNIVWDKKTISGDFMWQRVLSRITEVCYPIYVPGNRRKEKAATMRKTMRNLVGL